MARITKMAIAVLFAGGMALAVPTSAYAESETTGGPGADCILCQWWG